MTDTFRITKGTEFIRGDANGDAALDIADPIAILQYLFEGGSTDCLAALDANDSDQVNIADPIAVLATLFSGAGPLAAPYPTCGVDPTPGMLTCVSSGCP